MNIDINVECVCMRVCVSVFVRVCVCVVELSLPVFVHFSQHFYDLKHRYLRSSSPKKIFCHLFGPNAYISVLYFQISALDIIDECSCHLGNRIGACFSSDNRIYNTQHKRKEAMFKLKSDKREPMSL